VNAESIACTPESPGIESVAVVFPGQGSQFPGMASDLIDQVPEARQLLEQANDILGYSLTDYMAGEHGEELNRTIHTQPAVFVHSMALWRTLSACCPLCPLVGAGHSLGEYSALCAAGALSFEDALRIVQVRAKAMDGSQPPGTCGMVALVGMQRDEVLATVEACRGTDVLEAANFNAPDQIVVSGHMAALNRVIASVKGQRRTKAVMLAVSSAFHTSLMEPAREALRRGLEPVDAAEATFPVIANVSAAPHPQESNEVKTLLTDQVVRPVLWEDSVRAMIDRGVQTFVEVGPGKVLTGLLRRIDRSARAINISDPEGIRSLERVLA
jgi:[acyl-carrier-protein] S-malonyltransferase